ncbi:MAG TPA: hypothetical protein VNC50_03655, partial [Planctomycetia bacterium]|nr:hypothetical protein [Planctomycetia bacterium]
MTEAADESGGGVRPASGVEPARPSGSPVPPAWARRRGLTTGQCAFIGCGTLTIAFLIAVGMSIYYGKKNLEKAWTTDAAQLRAWLREEMDFDIPKGYEAIEGRKANVLGTTLMTVILAPPGTKTGKDADPKATTFTIMRAPMIDQAKGDDSQKTAERTVTKSETITVVIGTKKATAERRETTEFGRERAEIQAPLRKGLTVLATGPREG